MVLSSCTGPDRGKAAHQPPYLFMTFSLPLTVLICLIVEVCLINVLLVALQMIWAHTAACFPHFWTMVLILVN